MRRQIVHAHFRTQSQITSKKLHNLDLQPVYLVDRCDREEVRDGVYYVPTSRSSSPLSRVATWSARLCGGTRRRSGRTWTGGRRPNRTGRTRPPTSAGDASMTGRGRPRAAATFRLQNSESSLECFNLQWDKLTVEAPKSASLGSENILENMNVLQTGRRSERQWRRKTKAAILFPGMPYTTGCYCTISWAFEFLFQIHKVPTE